MNEQSVKAIVDQNFGIRPMGVVVGVTLKGHRHYFTSGAIPLHQAKAQALLPKDRVLFIGSNTKVFTGTLLALASIEGIVNLDTPVKTLLPKGVTIQEPYGQILLWHLATHSSGFPDGQCKFGHYKFGAYPFDFEGRFLEQFIPNCAPGTYWVYSNQAFGLLGVLLSHAFSNNTQKSKSWDKSYQEWPKHVVSRITAPLGMNSTQVDYTGVEARVAQGYVIQKNGDYKPQPPPDWDLGSAGLPAGALSSTAEDMLTFLEAEMRPPEGILGQAIKLTQQPCPSPGASNNLSMGLG